MDSGVFGLEGKGEHHQGMDNIAFDHSENVERKSSAISNNIDRFNKRDEQLAEARTIIERNAQDGKITSDQLGNLFKDERFSLTLFGLFTEEDDLDLEQSYWTNKLLDWTGEAGEDEVIKIDPADKQFERQVFGLLFSFSSFKLANLLQRRQEQYFTFTSSL